MRYLYGDSLPFPLGYNFLGFLESFMTAATRIVELDGTIKKNVSDADEAARIRQHGIDSLEMFHTELMRALGEASADSQHAMTLGYAKQINDFAMRLMEETKRGAITQNEADSALGRTQLEAMRREVQTKVDTLLKVARLPIQGQEAQLVMGEGKDASYEVMATFQNARGVTAKFRLGTPAGSHWTRPRRVGDVQPGTELRVAVKKSFFGGTVTAEKLKIDDLVFHELILGDERAEISLKRKPTERVHLVLRRTDQDGRVVITADHPGDPNAASVAPELEEDDVAIVEKLILALQVDVKDLYAHKEELLFAKLDDVDVVNGDRSLDLVTRLVEYFAPTVNEVARRSPSPQELSLKLEGDDGRREEVYLRKDELIKKLQPLSAAGRSVFAPLGLDSWVPGVTMRPPPVV
ncbi:hypothetical protein BH09MYX1_BH09MYX1_37030 [soil metagenome]